ncbi:MAG: hypothetical protein DMD35_08000 [Gemmatimonadetes bacterium]|nr:MAG: hypothetical protein DMD35_08000 [Gemmatimonadota bacterium]
MRARTLVVTALIAASAALGSCSGDAVLPTLVIGGGTSGDTVNTTRIRLVNATGIGLDLAKNGVVFAGNKGIVYGGSSTCTPTNALTPDLSVRIAGTLAPIPGLAATYQSGVNYTVVAYTGTLGETLFATIADTFAPVAGQSALRVFNTAVATGASYDVYVTDPGAGLDTTATPSFSNVAPGAFTAFANASADAPRQIRITLTGSKAVLLDLGNTALVAGQSVTLVIVSPLVGSTRIRAFSAEGCNT